MKIFTSFDPELLLLGIYPNEIIQKERKIIYVSIFTSVFSNTMEERDDLNIQQQGLMKETAVHPPDKIAIKTKDG